jgi:flagellar motor protein MotB
VVSIPCVVVGIVTRMMARAEAVKICLMEQFKLSPDQLLALGFARSEPKNTTDLMAAENRRVRIVNGRDREARGL